MTTLVIIAIAIFAAYLTTVVCMFGIPASISDTYYKLEKRKKGLGWLFTAMCWSVGGLLLPALLEITPENCQFTAFLACTGIMFVGAAPQFKLSLTGSVHYVSAAVCVIFSQFWVALTPVWWVLLPVWAVYITGTIWYMAKHVSSSIVTDFLKTKPMFWVEIAALTATVITALIYYLRQQV